MLTLSSIFLRAHNALLVTGQFTELFTDYYLHLNDNQLRYNPALDQMLKDALATLSLHLAARPRGETIAWTANLRAPRINLFVTGSSEERSVAGRVFTEDVREPDRNYFYAQTTAPGTDPVLSTIEVPTNDPIEWVETYYRQSEQRPVRCFRLPDEHYALIVAQPACDLPWLEALDATAAEALVQATAADGAPDARLLETRDFRFHCGCSLKRILPILGGWRDRLGELFHDANEITIQCPRCGARYPVSRQQIEEA